MQARWHSVLTKIATLFDHCRKCSWQVICGVELPGVSCDLCTHRCIIYYVFINVVILIFDFMQKNFIDFRRTFYMLEFFIIILSKYVFIFKYKLFNIFKYEILLIIKSCELLHYADCRSIFRLNQGFKLSEKHSLIHLAITRSHIFLFRMSRNNIKPKFANYPCHRSATHWKSAI